MLKLVRPGTDEVDVYERLLRGGHASPNHTIPCEIIHDDERPFLIMPWLESTDFFYRLRDMLDYLHHVIEVLLTLLGVQTLTRLLTAIF